MVALFLTRYHAISCGSSAWKTSSGSTVRPPSATLSCPVGPSLFRTHLQLGPPLPKGRFRAYRLRAANVPFSRHGLKCQVISHVTILVG